MHCIRIEFPGIGVGVLFSKKSFFVFYVISFAPWCPACKNLSPIWAKFAKTAESKGVKVAKVDVTQSPSLSGRFFVTALPTIYQYVFNMK